MKKATELKRLQKAYLKAKAAHDHVKSLDRAIRNKVLADGEYLSQDTGEPIESYKSDYQMTEEAFEGYCQEVYREGLRRGLELRDANTVADWKTGPLLRRAEDELLNFAIYELLPQDQREDFKEVKEHYEYRDEMLSLTCKLVLPETLERADGLIS